MKYYWFPEIGKIKTGVYVAQFENYAIIASEDHIYRQSGQISIPKTQDFEISKAVFDLEYYKILNKFNV
jgi:hypothetical protein